MGVSALAISNRPDLFQQDQGLKDYITAHEQDLRAALAKVKADAAAALAQHDAQAALPSVLAVKQKWLGCLAG